MIDFQLITQIITWGSLGIGAVVGYFQITAKIRSDKEKSDAKLFDKMDVKTEQIINSVKEEMKVVDSKFGSVDTRINKEEEDIEDVENDMKEMITEFKAMCEKLQKHDFILQDVLPDFKSLQKEFQNFKSKVSNHINNSTIEGSTLVNSKHIEQNKDDDSENR